jgi:hypothetical protein
MKLQARMTDTIGTMVMILGALLMLGAVAYFFFG